MIEQTQTTSFKVECYQGIHDLDTDVLKMALYNANADLNADTTVYSLTNEITGTGYSAGGKICQNVTISSSDNTAYVSFDNVVWTGAAFTCRGALIYNSSKGNKSIAVLNFGSDKTCNSTFTVTLPANTANSALIRNA